VASYSEIVPVYGKRSDGILVWLSSTRIIIKNI